jgi:hypothetical protein
MCRAVESIKLFPSVCTDEVVIRLLMTPSSQSNTDNVTVYLTSSQWMKNQTSGVCTTSLPGKILPELYLRGNKVDWKWLQNNLERRRPRAQYRLVDHRLLLIPKGGLKLISNPLHWIPQYTKADEITTAMSADDQQLGLPNLELSWPSLFAVSTHVWWCLMLWEPICCIVWMLKALWISILF